MTTEATGLFFANEPVKVQMPNCSLINEADLTSHMAQCAVERLQVLELGFCGRGLSTQCLTSTIATGPGNLPMLTTVSFRGAYRLSDQGVAALVEAAPNLTSLDLTQCSLLSIASVKSVGDVLGPKLKSFSLEGCDKLDAMQLLPILLQMTNLQKLSLSGVGGMKDEIVSELAVTLGPYLEELRLADCRLLTDVAIAGVAACCPGLKVLDLDALPHLTDTAIGRIADGCLSLQKIYLKRAKLTDEAVAAFVMASGSCIA
jgi:DNA repair protein RAD7